MASSGCAVACPCVSCVGGPRAGHSTPHGVTTDQSKGAKSLRLSCWPHSDEAVWLASCILSTVCSCPSFHPQEPPMRGALHGFSQSLLMSVVASMQVQCLNGDSLRKFVPISSGHLTRHCQEQPDSVHATPPSAVCTHCGEPLRHSLQAGEPQLSQHSWPQHSLTDASSPQPTQHHVLWHFPHP